MRRVLALAPSQRFLRVILALFATLILSAPSTTAAQSVSEQIATLGLPESNITFSADELATFLNTSIAHGEPAQRNLAKKILAALSDRNVTLENGRLVYEAPYPQQTTGEIHGVPDESHCTEV